MTVVSVRTDPETDAALEVLGNQFGNLTDTIKVAIQRLADEQRRARLREAATIAANDPDDLAETRAVMADMESVRAW